jgi:hypothetical protein
MDEVESTVLSFIISAWVAERARVGFELFNLNDGS